MGDSVPQVRVGLILAVPGLWVYGVPLELERIPFLVESRLSLISHLVCTEMLVEPIQEMNPNITPYPVHRLPNTPRYLLPHHGPDIQFAADDWELI